MKVAQALARCLLAGCATPCAYAEEPTTTVSDAIAEWPTVDKPRLASSIAIDAAPTPHPSGGFRCPVGEPPGPGAFGDRQRELQAWSDQFRTVFEEHRNEALDCYALHSDRDVEASGFVAVFVWLDATGEVERTELGADRIGEPAVAACLVALPLNYSFPAPLDTYEGPRRYDYRFPLAKPRP